MRVTIVGGGVSGLAAAYYMRRAAADAGQLVDIRVCERRSRAGGQLATSRRRGYLIEQGTDAFLRTRPAAVELCRALGLADEIVPTNQDRATEYVYVRGRLRRVPAGLLLVAPTRLGPWLASGVLSPAGRLRALADLVLPARRSGEDESVGCFLRRRFGDEMAANLGQPRLAAAYAGDVDALSAAATFPELVALEREHGSVIRGARARSAALGGEAAPPGERHKSLYVSLLGGMDTLVDALVSALGPEIVRTDRGVLGIEPRKGDSGPYYRVMLSENTARNCEHVVLATLAPAAVSLVANLAPHLARGIAALRHVSSAVVSLGYKAEDVRRPLDGYGFQVGRSESLGIRGCTWSSTKLPRRAPTGRVLLRTEFGGDGHEDEAAMDDDTLIQRAQVAAEVVVGARGKPSLVDVARWPSARPQYAVGHLDRVAALREICPPGLHLLGASYDGVTLPECVAGARKLAQALVQEAAGPGQ